MHNKRKFEVLPKWITVLRQAYIHNERMPKKNEYGQNLKEEAMNVDVEDIQDVLIFNAISSIKIQILDKSASFHLYFNKD